jgi:hypothetical protein
VGKEEREEEKEREERERGICLDHSVAEEDQVRESHD